MHVREKHTGDSGQQERKHSWDKNKMPKEEEKVFVYGF